jgi:mono/diheme cytochrome c family protein
MRPVVAAMAGALVLAVIFAIGGLVYLRGTGLRGQPRPGPIETRIARLVRGLAIPRPSSLRTNPIPATSDAIAKGLDHYAHYCTMCHGNDGSGEDTPLGQGLFPKPPDLRAEATQNLADGDLLYIIVNGVRFTGMPAFGTGTEDAAGEELAWQLVHFVRRLPRLTPEEVDQIASLNPLSEQSAPR